MGKGPEITQPSDASCPRGEGPSQTQEDGARETRREQGGMVVKARKPRGSHVGSQAGSADAIGHRALEVSWAPALD